MAEKQIEITLTWENEVSFVMQLKEPGESYKDVISLEENSNSASIWDNIANICNTTFKNHIAAIGEEMKT